jgi:hypothetical protein
VSRVTGDSFAYSFHIGIFQSRRRLGSNLATIEIKKESQIGVSPVRDWTGDFCPGNSTELRVVRVSLFSQLMNCRIVKSLLRLLAESAYVPTTDNRLVIRGCSMASARLGSVTDILRRPGFYLHHIHFDTLD